MAITGKTSLWSAVLGAAEYRWSTGEYQRAEDLFRRAISLAEKANGPEHPEVVVLHLCLADFLCAQRRLAEAETIYRYCLKLIAKQCGSDGILFALALRSLGEMLGQQDRGDEADVLRQRASQVLKACQLIFAA